MYANIEGLLTLAQSRAVPLWRVVLDSECALAQCSEEAVFQGLEERYDVMCQAATRALTQPLPTAGGLIRGVAMAQFAHSGGGNTVGGSFLNLVMARALSCSETNAAMGKICAAPTAGACGILPAVLISVREKYDLTLRQVLEGLLTASGIGAVITKNATVSGAEGGCQAECGTAAAMAAAATVEMVGGTPQQAVDACGWALINCMGLVCDPVAGLVQVPCAQRNASQAVNAIVSADLVLGGMCGVIPPDQVVEAMGKVGRMLPTALKETGRGGIAATPAGKAITRRIFQ